MQPVTQYAAKACPASEGGRNHTAFNLAGHLAAFETEDGRLRLTEPQVLDLLRTWNHRNSPPLPESELIKVVNSAMNNGTPRAQHVIRASTEPTTSKTVKSPPRPPHSEVLEAGSKPNGAEIMEGEGEYSTEALNPQATDMEQVGCPIGEQPPDEIRFAGTDGVAAPWEPI